MFHFEVTDDSIPAETQRACQTDTVMNEEFVVGDRIHDLEKYTGEIKYVGSVGTFPGVWLGVEWDNPLRGKHNGSVDDIKYFDCSSPTSGSFIRPHKAKKIHSLKSALEQRYGHDEAVYNVLKSIEDRLEKTKISYSQLCSLNLSSKGIVDSSEDIPYLITCCPNIQTIELADNLIRSWSFVGSLCSAYDKLTRVDLSKNPMSEITVEEIEMCKTAFSNVDHVVLGSTGYEWASILKLSVIWPKLTNLQIPFNLIATLTPPTVGMMNVTSLDLEGNKICCWNEVLKLTVLDRLKYLNLCGNTLKTIRFPAQTDQIHCLQTSFFPSLKKLNITENSIDDWISVSELHKLKTLEELRIDLNPLMNKDTRANNRHMIIARLGKIQKLEGAEIHRQERRDAEIDYVKKYASQWDTEKDSFRFNAENPRYRDLVEKWGKSEIGEVDTVIKTMKSSLLNLTLVPQGNSQASHKQISKKIVPSMTVQKLKGLIQRLYKTENTPVQITAVSSRNPGIIFILDDDFKELGSCSVEEGDKLLIEW